MSDQPVVIYTYSNRKHFTSDPDYVPVDRWGQGFFPALCSTITWGRKEPVHELEADKMPMCKLCLRAQAKQNSQ